MLAYCAGQIAGSLPVTSGGLGVVEGSLTLALVAFGGDQTITLAAVLLYRIIGPGSPWSVASSSEPSLATWVATRTRAPNNASGERGDANGVDELYGLQRIRGRNHRTKLGKLERRHVPNSGTSGSDHGSEH